MMGNKHTWYHPGIDDMSSQVREAVRKAEIFNGERIPVNEAEARSEDAGDSPDHPYRSITDDADLGVAGMLDGEELVPDGGAVVQQNQSAPSPAPESRFETDPAGQPWWWNGDKSFIYSDEVPEAVQYGDDALSPQEYLSAEHLERIRVMVDATEIDRENFLEEVESSNINPVNRWQITQLLDGEPRYATEPSDYDGAPMPPAEEVEILDRVTEDAFEEYVSSRGYIPGTSFDTYVRDRTEETDNVDPRGVMGM